MNRQQFNQALEVVSTHTSQFANNMVAVGHQTAESAFVAFDLLIDLIYIGLVGSLSSNALSNAFSLGAYAYERSLQKAFDYAPLMLDQAAGYILAAIDIAFVWLSHRDCSQLLIGCKQLGVIGHTVLAYIFQSLWLGACALFFLGSCLVAFPGYAKHWCLFTYRQYVIPAYKKTIALMNVAGRAWSQLRGLRRIVAAVLILPLLSFRYASSRRDVWRYLQHVALFDMFFLPMLIPSVATSWVLLSLLLRVSVAGLWAVGAYHYLQPIARYQWEDITLPSGLGVVRVSAQEFDPVQAAHLSGYVCNSSDLPQAVPTAGALVGMPVVGS